MVPCVKPWEAISRQPITEVRGQREKDEVMGEDRMPPSQLKQQEGGIGNEKRWW